MTRLRFLTAALAALAASTAHGAAPAPAPAVAYTMQRGDSLFALWRAYFTGPTAVREVRAINHIGNVRRISTGKVLQIPRRLLRDEMSPAKLETFSGPVVIRSGGAAHAAQVGETLGEGAEVECGRNAFATLRLADGSALSIPSQSGLRLAWLRKVRLTGALEREIAVTAGKLRAKVTPMTNPDSSFRVVTPVAVSAVRGTEFRVDFDEAAAFSASQVDEGKVAFDEPAAGSALMLPSGFGAADAGGKSTGVVKLLPPPGLVDADKVQSEDLLHFAIAPMAAATRYRLQLARDAGFLEQIGEQTGADPAFTLPSIPADSYFIRVSAYDGYGLEGLSATYTFERRRNLVSGKADGAAPGERRLRFRWDGTVDGTPQYRFQLVRQGAPGVTPDVPVVDEAGLTATVLSVSNLPPGDYAWRVCSTILVKGKVVATWTAPQRLHLGK